MSQAIEVDIRPGDFRAFARFILRKRRWLPLIGAFAVGIFLGVFLDFIQKLTGDRLDPASVATGVAGGVISLIIFSSFMRRGLSPDPDGLTLGRKQITISPEGVRHSSVKHESLFRWSAVRSISVTPQHVFVMLDRNAGIIIPQSSFASATAAEQFIAEANGLWKAGLNSNTGNAPVSS